MSNRPTGRDRALTRDAGMSMVEVMVALVLFALLTTGILLTVTRASRLTHEDAARTAATNLAVREIEITRDTFAGVTRGPDRIKEGMVTNPSPLPGKRVGQDLVVDGTKFRVERTASWKQRGNTASACDQGSSVELGYLEVDVDVSWNAQGREKSVHMATTMTPPKGTYSALTGHIGVKVIDRDGEPVSGATVTATGAMTKSGATAGDGCVLLAFLTPGTYTLTMNLAGHVNPAGDATARTTANVVTGQLWRGTIEYDRAATINVTFATQVGWSLPPATAAGINQVAVTIGNSALIPGGSRSVTGTGLNRVLTKLWPYPSGYEVWAGSCVDSDPGDDRAAPVAADPEALVAPAATATLAPLTVRGTTGQVITATHAADTACPSGVTITLGATLDGELRTSLPYGTWTIKRSGSGSTKVVTLRPTDTAVPTVTP
ncbi:carboxypeptidase regulatory-like domain-containing protein [Nocardioides sp. 1609]|uniref:carboxypeptidase regulatory-like domain-containing protein n=1 Tax=Nocardioides sp. 1609 TaxID=2508327 RepID=UPI00106F2409|nr:carboxypeptidase regulatory-like domain-containing protein [Nocardioides sp. 1609]